MTTRSGSTTFSFLFNTSSKELYSEKFYDAMDKDFLNLDNYDNICKKKLTSKNELKMIPICKKYLRFLDNSKVWGETDAEYDVSLLLYYWLYDKISSSYSITDIDRISIYFGSLQGIWDHFKDSQNRESYYYKFKPEVNIFKEDDWKKKRELYECYVSYDTLLRAAQWYPQNCKDYYGKIKEMISVYESFQGKCSHEGKNCPNFFDKFKKKNPVHNLQNLSCYIQMHNQKTVDAEAGPSTRGDSLQSGVPNPGHPHGVHGDLADSAGSTRDKQSTSQSSDIQTKVANSVLGAAPVLFTATMLYRYTPLGPWIRRFGGGRTNNMGAMDTLSPYTQETGDMFSNDSENYISYQPI